MPNRSVPLERARQPDYLIAMARSVFNSLLSFLPKRWRERTPLVPVVRLAGVIGYVTPLRPGMTLSGTARMLERAFKIRGAKAVALVINSPGGSAAQSHLIYQRIRALADEHKRPVIAFVEDVAASGGYMIACAADEIVIDPNSIVGSIGVVAASFGFDKLLRRISVDRRVYTAGERKMMLDPFQPEQPEDVKRLKTAQKDIHAEFIALVKNSRGKRLKGGDKTLFSGEFWVGGEAVRLGLADEIGDLRSVLRKRFGKKVQTPLVTPPTGLFAWRAGGGVTEQGLPADWAGGLVSALEARALWARFGL
jgi:serine protease SohB